MIDCKEHDRSGVAGIGKILERVAYSVCLEIIDG
jgi:hypothetical protein